MRHYVHHLPGRLRVRTHNLKRNDVRVRDVHGYLCRIQGVLEVDVNPLTGSVLIRYDVALVDALTLLHSLKHLGCMHPDTHVESAARVSGTHPLVQRVSDAVVGKAVEAALERSAIAIIAAIL